MPPRYPSDYVTVMRPVSRAPHDPSSYTEGLCLHRGLLFESSGLLGASALSTTPLASLFTAAASEATHADAAAAAAFAAQQQQQQQQRQSRGVLPQDPASAAEAALLASRFPALFPFSPPSPSSAAAPSFAGSTFVPPTAQPQSFRLPSPSPNVFAEGLAASDGLLFQLTLSQNTLLVFNAQEVSRRAAEASASSASARTRPAASTSTSHGPQSWLWCTVPLPAVWQDPRFPRSQQWWGLGAWDPLDTDATAEALGIDVRAQSHIIDTDDDDYTDNRSRKSNKNIKKHSASASATSPYASAFERAWARGGATARVFSLWVSDGSAALRLMRVSLDDTDGLHGADGPAGGAAGDGARCGAADWVAVGRDAAAGRSDAEQRQRQHYDPQSAYGRQQAQEQWERAKSRALRVVTPAGAEVRGLNELEVVRVRRGSGEVVSEIWANVLQVRVWC